MTVLSCLRHIVRNTTKPISLQNNAVIQRYMSGDHHRTFPLAPSRWQWNRFKDLLHFYIMLGAIPLALITFGANVFIGPGTLSEIPEDYTPKHYEYYKRPITRFIAQYILNNPQQDYEKYLAYIYFENEKRLLRTIEAQVKQKMAERNDYQAYYFRAPMAKYHRATRESADKLESIMGD